MQSRWSILALLVVVRAVFAYQFSAVSAVSPQLINAYGMDYASLGTLASVYLLPGLFLAMPSGIAGKASSAQVLRPETRGVGLGLHLIGTTAA